MLARQSAASSRVTPPAMNVAAPSTMPSWRAARTSGDASRYTGETHRIAHHVLGDDREPGRRGSAARRQQRDELADPDVSPRQRCDANPRVGVRPFVDLELPGLLRIVEAVDGRRRSIE